MAPTGISKIFHNPSWTSLCCRPQQQHNACVFTCPAFHFERHPYQEHLGQHIHNSSYRTFSLAQMDWGKQVLVHCIYITLDLSWDEREQVRKKDNQVMTSVGFCSLKCTYAPIGPQSTAFLHELHSLKSDSWCFESWWFMGFFSWAFDRQCEGIMSSPYRQL